MLKHFNIRNIFVVSLCMAALPLLAAEGAAGAPQQQMMEKTIIGLAITAIIAALAAIGWVMNVLLTTQRMRLLEEHGIEGLQKAGIKVRTEPLWKQWYKRLTQTVPVAQEKSILMDHDYDGIRELDNRLPPWWVATFYVSIAFGIFYMGYTHFSDYGQTTEEWYTMEMEEAEAQLKRSPLLVEDESFTDYVREVGCRVAGPYCDDINIYVIRDPHFNASMAPNGAMLVNTGLLIRMSSGDQLAAGVSPAARRYARYRLPARRAEALPWREAPSWCLLTGRMVDISSTEIRQRGDW